MRVLHRGRNFHRDVDSNGSLKNVFLFLSFSRSRICHPIIIPYKQSDDLLALDLE